MLSEVCWSNTCDGALPLVIDLSGNERHIDTVPFVHILEINVVVFVQVNCVNCNKNKAQLSDKEIKSNDKAQSSVLIFSEQNQNDIADEDDDSDGYFAAILKDVADKYKK